MLKKYRIKDDFLQTHKWVVLGLAFLLVVVLFAGVVTIGQALAQCGCFQPFINFFFPGGFFTTIGHWFLAFLLLIFYLGLVVFAFGKSL